MIRDDFKLLFKNFEPDFHLRTIVHSVFERIYQLAPSTASLMGEIAKEGSAFIAKVRIKGVGHDRLEALHKSHDLDQLMQGLSDKIVGQLDRWKSARFAEIKA